MPCSRRRELWVYKREMESEQHFPVVSGEYSTIHRVLGFFWCTIVGKQSTALGGSLLWFGSGSNPGIQQSAPPLYHTRVSTGILRSCSQQNSGKSKEEQDPVHVIFSDLGFCSDLLDWLFR